MIRGEFIRGDGVVLPNNITTLGLQTLLLAAMQGVTPTFYMGLGGGVFVPGILPAAMEEPANGVGGYARQKLAVGNTDWPTLGELNGEQYIESRSVVFTPTGAGFSRAISRPFLASAATNGNILMLGSALATPIQLLSTTELNSRTFRYRLYLR